LSIHEVKGNTSSGGGGGGKGKGKSEAEKIWDRPKSKEVKRLEGIVDRLKELQAGEGKVVRRETDMPDCFCQGQFSVACSRWSKLMGQQLEYIHYQPTRLIVQVAA
jgi:hypothetical protein